MGPAHYSIHEAFYTWQGEGVHAGRAAFFIRTMGCDQRCWFCDAAGTWHRDHMPADVLRLGPEDTAALTDDAVPGAIVVITGGEPCLYDLDPLVTALHARGRAVHLETAGHRPLPSSPDVWVTLSPKPFAAPPLPENVERADEHKVIVSDAVSLREGLHAVGLRRPDAPVWLHPEWSHRADPDTLGLITDAVKANPTLRAGWQLHKNYRADLADPAARSNPVPLGGVDGAPY